MNININVESVDFQKSALVPAVIQDEITDQVLMVGFMNREALDKTIESGRVTFFSRSKNRLWTKGETSGNFLYVKSITADCDRDTLLIKAEPAGPVCHLGNTSCFDNDSPKGFLYRLQDIIENRIAADDPSSYTNALFRKGINKIAQKVGEEAVELIIEAKDENQELFKNEAADLFYHILILLKAKNLKLRDIEEVLEGRH